MFLAKKYYLTTGVGVDEYEIASFDKALMDAGLSEYNLVKVSSIIPPFAKQCMFVDSTPGSILFTAYSQIATKKDEIIASAIVAAIPNENNYTGVIMEYSCLGSKEKALGVARQLAADAMYRRKVNDYRMIDKCIEATGTSGLTTTTFCAIALM